MVSQHIQKKGGGKQISEFLPVDMAPISLL